MGERKNQNYKVVWAKVRGYPWWPGIIESRRTRHSKSKLEESNILVRFIGETTQYSLASSTLSPKSIKDFNDDSSLVSQPCKNRKLNQSISQALMFLDGKLTYDDLFSAKDQAETLESTANAKKVLKEKFKAIQEAIKDRSELDLSSTSDPDDFNRHLSFLIELSKSNLSEVDITTELCEALFELVRMKVSSNLLEKSKIQNVLKMISKVCHKSKCWTVNKLGHLIKELRNYYKEILKLSEIQSEQVKDKSLRRMVLQKTARILEFKSVDRTKAQEIALKVEKKIRQKDPSMTKVYNNYIKKMLKDFRRIPPDGLLGFN